jgi:hypothetical protein
LVSSHHGLGATAAAAMEPAVVLLSSHDQECEVEGSVLDDEVEEDEDDVHQEDVEGEGKSDGEHWQGDMYTRLFMSEADALGWCAWNRYCSHRQGQCWYVESLVQLHSFLLKTRCEVRRLVQLHSFPSQDQV